MVEDEELVRAMMMEALTENGYDVLEARNGRHALEVAAQYEGKIDLLLTDVVMPRMGGPELWEILAPRYPDMGLLYVSGHTERDLKPRGSFLKKPFSPDALTAKVRETLDRRSVAVWQDAEKGSSSASADTG